MSEVVLLTARFRWASVLAQHHGYGIDELIESEGFAQEGYLRWLARRDYRTHQHYRWQV